MFFNYYIIINFLIFFVFIDCFSNTNTTLFEKLKQDFIF